MQKIVSIFKNLYSLLLVIIIVTAIYLCNFMRTYLYDTIYNFQIISVFRRDIPMPNIEEFEKIEHDIAKKGEEKDINWKEIKDPFNPSPVATE